MSVQFPTTLISFLRAAKKVVVLTGAGVSQESGLRTFRDDQTGMWAQFRPEDLATPEAFMRNPKLVWDWYAERRMRAGSVEPNAGHYALAAMQKYFEQFTLITQNVDGLHQKAGSLEVIELHGNLQRVKCFSCGRQAEVWNESGADVPTCDACGGLLRPDVVWFGEQLPIAALELAVERTRSCDVFFSIGTSGLVQPAASLAVAAMHKGAVIVEINKDITPLTEKADYALHGKAGEILPSLVKAVWG